MGKLLAEQPATVKEKPQTTDKPKGKKPKKKSYQAWLKKKKAKGKKNTDGADATTPDPNETEQEREEDEEVTEMGDDADNQEAPAGSDTTPQPETLARATKLLAEQPATV